MLINKTSLSQTVDAIHDAAFEGRPLGADERKRTALWIAGRQGLAGAYGGTFAGFPHERSTGIVLFTGERITSASARHILGEEASRALRGLRVGDARVTTALDRASEGLMKCLERAAADPRKNNPGTFCCGKCTVGVWRNLLSGGLDRQEERLARGVDYLRSTRGGDGEWRKFPFWYTVLALSEIDLPDARNELRYAAPALERTAGRKPAATPYARRRHALAQRALARVSSSQ
jgi:hypothetical protein